jgi:hypothetical protein
MYLKDTNESLTRIGPRTPMGDLLRRFWLPAFLEHELPRFGGDPVEFKLLGEELVAENAGQGRILITDRYFKEMAPYPAVAQGGIVWAYMGPKDFKPQLPGFSWLALPPLKRATARRVEPCTWAYSLEKNLAFESQPEFLPPFYASSSHERCHAHVPVDETHTCIWTFGANAHLDADETPGPPSGTIMDFHHDMVAMARENARGIGPEAALRPEWYDGRPFPV